VKTVSRDAQTGRERRRGNADDPGSIQHYAGFSKEIGLFVTMRVREGKILSVGLTEEPPEDASTGGHPFLSRILEHIATGKDDMRDMPLDLDVTPFERQVLEALRDIPPGEVATYGDIARKIGRPRAYRAVGRACAINPAIVVVPCHRVVPSSGGLGNYSGAGGTSTKRRLLDREGALQDLNERSSKR